MEVAKQRMRAVAARKKEEERKVKEKEGVSSSTPKTVAKVSKRKPDENDDCPSKKVVVTPGDMPSKKKSPLKSSQGTGREVVTSSGPVIEVLHKVNGHSTLQSIRDEGLRGVNSF